MRQFHVANAVCLEVHTHELNDLHGVSSFDNINHRA